MSASQAAPPATTPEPIILDEYGVAKLLGLSVAWVRKDRLSERVLSFYRIGKKAIRYNRHTVFSDLQKYQEGGASSRRRAGA